ncbi:MAG: hypothetical protein ABSD57_10880 [Verrucomicrobiota bacterium]|jgi:hypothetical protein
MENHGILKRPRWSSVWKAGLIGAAAESLMAFITIILAAMLGGRQPYLDTGFPIGPMWRLTVDPVIRILHAVGLEKYRTIHGSSIIFFGASSLLGFLVGVLIACLFPSLKNIKKKLRRHHE